MSKPAAFFDLDRTLIDVNSAILWAQHERKHGHISVGQLVKASIWTALYHLSIVNVEKAMDQAIAHYRGADVDAIDARTRAWFDEDVQPRMRPGAEKALAFHRTAGHPLVLLTSSSSYEASAAAAAWQLDAWLANAFPAEDGHLQGTVSRPLCYGAGKVTHAQKWADDNDVDLKQSFFYTDSYSDLPMLDAVGEPRIVAPDPRLKRVAAARKWKVEVW